LTQQQKSRDDGIDGPAAAVAAAASKLEQLIVCGISTKMPVYCAAFGCKNLDSKELRQQEITFHKQVTCFFPVVAYIPWQPGPSAVICSAHFTEY